MDTLLNSGVQFVIWLQSLGGWLTPIMKLFTFLGNEQFYLLVAPAIMWCVDSTLGIRVALFLMINGMVNASLKVGFHTPRPYWNSNNIKVFGIYENSFGIPSGHAQNAIVIWGTVAQRIKQRLPWLIAFFIMFMVGISRLYLGVHSLQDVLLGWLFGVAMLCLLLYVEKPLVNFIKKFSTGMQVILAFLVSLAFILLIIIVKFSLGGWTLPSEWISNAHLAFPDEPSLTPLSYNNFLASPGAFFGLAAGWIWICSQGRFSTKDDWWKLVLRYLVGILGVLAVYLGLGALFPKEETLLAYTLRYVRYAMIGFWISGLGPWFFMRIKLASRESPLILQTKQAGD